VSFFGAARQRFRTDRPVDWSGRTACEIFFAEVGRTDSLTTIEGRIAEFVRAGVRTGDARHWQIAAVMLRRLATRLAEKAQRLLRAAELVESHLSERELALLDEQARARKGTA
jgi:hypothetical protein